VTDFSFLDGKTDADLLEAAKTPSADWNAALEDQAQARIRAAAVSAQDANPDQAAQAVKLGAQTGIPADVAARNLQDVKRKAYLDDVDRVFSEEPGLARWFMNPVNAQLTRDDLANIEKLPSLWRGIGDTLRSIPGGAVSGTGAFVAGAGELMAAADRGLNRLNPFQTLFPNAAANEQAAEKSALFRSSLPETMIGTGGAIKT
jgi:hypothetical protein